jgi:hypothetical protein
VSRALHCGWKKFGPARTPARRILIDKSEINTGAHKVRSTWSTSCRADWGRNDPVLTTRGWLLRHYDPVSPGSCKHQGADLRKRALEVKKRDEGLRKRDLEVKERDELNGFVEDANAELRKQPQRPQQQRQVLKGSQRAMKGSVSHIITVGLRHSNK